MNCMLRSLLGAAGEFVSNTVSVPAFSLVTKPSAPSFVNAIDLGRGPVFTEPTTFSVFVSTPVTTPSPSDVT